MNNLSLDKETISKLEELWDLLRDETLDDEFYSRILGGATGGGTGQAKTYAAGCGGCGANCACTCSYACEATCQVSCYSQSNLWCYNDPFAPQV